ncbi:MAG: acyloxyacyl hydrolase [Planctomycetes bacterium]|nr:acyloxyacyl hydrolase [Planctomycetota bacterium]
MGKLRGVFLGLPAALCLLGLPLSNALAQEPPPPASWEIPNGTSEMVPAGQDNDPFTAGSWSLQFVSGAQFAPTIVGPTTQAFDLVPFSLRLGLMLNTPQMEPGSLLRGNFECFIDETFMDVAKGPGNYLWGPSALLRYNFVQPDWRLIPYFQAGAGFVFNDIYKDPNQHAIGESFEFLLQFGTGAHYLLSDNWSLDAETNFMHISNAGLAKHNIGINAPGASLGLTWFFNRPR